MAQISSDLNVFYFCISSVLEKNACATPAKSVIILRQRLVKAWSRIDLNILHSLVEDFPHRLRAVIKGKGDHLE